MRQSALGAFAGVLVALSACLALADDTAWDNPAGGYFADGINWVGGGPPGTDDRAIFNLFQTTPYTVQLTDDVANYRLSLHNDKVVLDLSGHTYDLLSTSSSAGSRSFEISRAAGQAGTLTVTNGEMKARYGYVGRDYGANGRLVVTGPNTRLDMTGSVHLGNTASMTISDGAKVSVAEVRSCLYWPHQLLVTGEGSELTVTSKYTMMHQGDLRIADGGKVSVPGTWYFSSSPGKVRLDGGTLELSNAGSTFPLRWTAGTLHATNGYSNSPTSPGFGSLDIGPGMTFVAKYLWIAEGTLELNGGVITTADSIHASSAGSNTGKIRINSGTLNIGDYRLGTDEEWYGGTINASDYWNDYVTLNNGKVLNVQGDLMSGLTIATGSAASVGGTTTLEEYEALVLNGGTFSTGRLVTDDDPQYGLQWNAGTFRLTDSDLAIDSSGVLRDSLVVDAGKALGVSKNLSIGSVSTGTLDVPVGGTVTIDGLTTVDASGALNLTGGFFATGQLILNGGSLNWTSGTLALTDTGLLVGSSGLLGSHLTLGAERILEVQGTTTVDASGTLTLDGGALRTGSFIQSGGTLSFLDGTLTVDAGTLDTGDNDLAIASAVGNPMLELVNGASASFSGNAMIGGSSGTLSLESGGALSVGNTTTIATGGTVNLRGGTLSTAVLDSDAGTFDWTSGTLHFNDALDLRPGGNFVPDLVVASGQTLSVTDGLTIGESGTLVLGGGTVVTPTLQNNGVFDWTDGTLNFTGDLEIGPDSNYIAAPDISSGKALVVGDTLAIGPGGAVTLAGGTIRAHSFTRSGGTFNFTDGTLIVDGGTFSIGTSDLIIDSFAGNPTLQLIGGASASPSGNVTVGFLGSGTLDVLDGASLDIGTALYIGTSGTVNLDGGSITTRSMSFLGPNLNLVGGLLSVEGGSFASGSVALSSGTGTPTLRLTDSTIGTVATDVILGNGGNGTLEVISGASLDVGGTLTLGSLGVLTIDGGSVWTTSFQNEGTLTFTDGTFTVDGGTFDNSAADLTIGGTGGNPTFELVNAALGVVRGDAFVEDGGTLGIHSGSSLTVGGTLEVAPGGGVDLDGGTINAATVLSGHLINWTSGTLNLTSGDLAIDPTGPFGDALAVGTGQTLGVSDDVNVGGAGVGTFDILTGGTVNVGGELTVSPDGTVTLDGGALTTPGIHFDGGTLDWLAGGINPGGESLLLRGSNAGGTLTVATGGALDVQDLTVGDGAGPVSMAVTVGGAVNVAGATTVNTMGTFTLDGGVVQTGSFIVDGGTFDFLDGALTVNGGSFDTGGTDLTISSATGNPTLELVNGASAGFSGNVTVGGSSGTLSLESGGALSVGNTTTVAAGGTVNLAGGVLSTETLDVGGGVLDWTAGTLHFTGDLTVGDGGMLGPAPTVGENRTLSVAGTLTIDPTGTLSVTGGTVTAGGTELTGGTFNTDAAGVLSGLSLNWTAGALNVTDDDLTVGSGGPLGATLTVGSDKRLGVSGTLAVAADGAVTLDGGTIRVGHLDHSAGETFTWDSGALHFLGDLDVTELLPSGGQAILSAGKALEVVGTTTVAAGEDVTLSGGVWSTGNLDNAGSVFLNSGTFNLTGADGLVVGADGPFGTTLDLGTNLQFNVTNDLVVDLGATLNVLGGFSAARGTNDGGIGAIGGTAEFSARVVNNSSGSISAISSTLDFGGGLTNYGSLIVINSTVHGTVKNKGGSVIMVTGNATFKNEVTGAGNYVGTGVVRFEDAYKPGDSVAAVSFGGGVEFASTSSLEVELGGTAAGQFDQLTIAGDATLNGTLDVALLDPFRPVHGDAFEVVTCGSRSGMFDTHTGLDLGARLALVPTYTPTGLVLTAAQGGSGEWQVDADGNASLPANWSQGVPNGVGDVATFGSAISASRQITVDVPTTLGGMVFDSAEAYALPGPNPLTFDTEAGAATINVADVAATHTIATDVILADALDIDVASLGTLAFEGLLDNSSGQTITKTGDGTLVINGPQDHAPGTVLEILGGTVDLNSEAGGPGTADVSILVNGAVLHFGCDQHLDTLTLSNDALARFTGANVVVLKHLVMDGVDLGAMTLTPEPATLALLAVGGLAFLRRKAASADRR